MQHATGRAGYAGTIARHTIWGPQPTILHICWKLCYVWIASHRNEPRLSTQSAKNALSRRKSAPVVCWCKPVGDVLQVPSDKCASNVKDQLFRNKNHHPQDSCILKIYHEIKREKSTLHLEEFLPDVTFLCNTLYGVPPFHFTCLSTL